MSEVVEKQEFVTVGLVLTPEIVERLKAEARRRTLNVSSLVRQIVAEYFERASVGE